MEDHKETKREGRYFWSRLTNCWRWTSLDFYAMSLGGDQPKEALHHKTEREYLLQIRHPNNPFSAEPNEEVTYSEELGRLTTDIVECPKTVFHFVKRTNSTTRMPGTNNADVEEANRRAVEIMELADPTTLLLKPSTRQVMAEHIKAYRWQINVRLHWQQKNQRCMTCYCMEYV